MQISIFYLNNYEVIHSKKAAPLGFAHFLVFKPPELWCAAPTEGLGQPTNFRHIVAAIFSLLKVFRSNVADAV